MNYEDSLLIREFLARAFEEDLYSRQRQNFLDSALLVNDKVARLWQQKAMPYYKARKYQIGKPFLAKAVNLEPKKYLAYSAFMKCIFSKEYEESISEFLLMKEEYGDSYIMDHTYNFYIGLCFLQLNEYDTAKNYLMQSKIQQLYDFSNDSPEEACHYLDWFYLGICEFELGNYEEAVNNFDTALSVYTKFSEAMYYKGLSLIKSGKFNSGNSFIELAEQNKNFTINEDNAIYELYPYQRYHLIQR